MTQQLNDSVLTDEQNAANHENVNEVVNENESVQGASQPEGEKEEQAKTDPFEGSELSEREIRRIRSLRARNHRLHDELQERDDVIKRLSGEMEAIRSKIDFDPKPSRDQYESDDKYIEELTEWKTRQTLLNAQKKHEEQAMEQRKNAAEMQRSDVEWQNNVGRVRSIAQDFDERVKASSNITVPEGTLNALRKMGPQGAGLYYHLMGSKDAVNSLWEYDGDAQGLEFALSLMIPDAMESVRSARNPKKDVSVAPPPAPKLSGSGGAKQIDPYDPSVPIDKRIEYLRRLRTQ